MTPTTVTKLHVEEAMSEFPPSIKNVNTRITPTHVFVELDTEEGAFSFRTNLEGLSILILHLQESGQRLVESLKSSGNDRAFNADSRVLGAEPMQVISAQAGRRPGTPDIIITAQTAEAPLVQLAFHPDQFRQLFEGAEDLLSKTPSDTPPPRLQ